MIKKHRTRINVIVGLVAVAFVILLSPKPIYKARGILLPAQKTRPSISPRQVVALQNRPDDAQVLGYINIEHRYPAPGQQAQKNIAHLAQQLSAKAGANAFFINLFRVGQVAPSKYIYVFRATAYYVPTSKTIN